MESKIEISNLIVSQAGLGFDLIGIAATIFITIVTSINVYSLLWALEGWDIVNFDWLRDQFSFLG